MITVYDMEKNPIEVDENTLVMQHNVYGIAIRDEKVLVVPRSNDTSYDFPGGHVELGEHHIDALKREFFEETGLEVKVGELICADTVFFIPQSHRRQYIEGQVYSSFVRSVIRSGKFLRQQRP